MNKLNLELNLLDNVLIQCRFNVSIKYMPNLLDPAWLVSFWFHMSSSRFGLDQAQLDLSLTNFIVFQLVLT